MFSVIRNIQLVAVLFVLFATVVAFVLEVREMYNNQTCNFFSRLTFNVHLY